MDRNLALEFVRITEAAALACARFTGRGDEKAADNAAVEAMRKAFDAVNIDGTVVIGEGERDEAPMLFIGEKVGAREPGSPKIDIALDPLEGTTICAKGGVGAIAVIAAAEEGCFLHAPDTYMDKIACSSVGIGVVDLKASPTENVHRMAEASKKPVEDLTVVILDRPRHKDLIEEVRKTGARIHLIGDGDVSAAIAAALPDSGIDLLLGVGGAPEGVIAAAAMRCLGGDFQGQLRFRNNDEIERAKRMGIEDPHARFQLGELAKGSVLFVATGVTDGPFLRGVRPLADRKARTYSCVMRSTSGTIRNIEALHDLSRKPKAWGVKDV